MSTPERDDIAAGNARQSEFYRSFTDRGIDPFAPSGPDPGDMDYDGPDDIDDDAEEPSCADCRVLGHICRPCHDDELAERRAEWAAERAEAGEYE